MQNVCHLELLIMKRCYIHYFIPMLVGEQFSFIQVLGAHQQLCTWNEIASSGRQTYNYIFYWSRIMHEVCSCTTK